CPKVINVSSEPTCDKFPKVVKGAGVASWGTGRRKKKKKECHERQEHCVGERNDTDHGGFVHRENRIPSKKKGENMSIQSTGRMSGLWRSMLALTALGLLAASPGVA